VWPTALAWDRQRPYLVDAGLAVALGAVSIPWIVLHTRSDLATWICTLALVVPLVERRRHPVGVFVVLAAVALVQWSVAGPVLADAALLVALFTVALERPTATALGAAAIVELGSIMASVRWSLGGSWDRSLIGLTGLTAAALLFGAALRVRRAHLDELTERAARLELERDQQAQIAAAAERTRIAREMHDVIAHSLAVIVTMADGATAKLPRDPGTAADAVRSISDVARQALADTRRLLGVLRDRTGAPELAPQPGLAGVDDLVYQLRSTGLEASVRYQGHLFDLAPGAELTIYRLVQEATTNTLKHAHNATEIQVSLTFDQPAVRLEITDDGEAPAPTVTGGHGLVGMRERVALYHGHVHAGPRPDRGWTVRASLDCAAHDG
jgi:signal transduction histidine kinase